MRFDPTRTLIVVSLSLAILILLGLGIAASPQLERSALLSDEVRAASPLEADEALERHESVRAFLLRGEALEGPTPQEISHLNDVRRLTEVLIGFSLLFIAIGFGAMRRAPTGYRTIARRVSLSVGGSVIVLVLIALAGGFESFFWHFHFIFFPQGNFTFPEDSYLITLYPRIFFAQMAAWTAGLIIAAMGVVYTLSRER